MSQDGVSMLQFEACVTERSVCPLPVKSLYLCHVIKDCRDSRILRLVPGSQLFDITYYCQLYMLYDHNEYSYFSLNLFRIFFLIDFEQIGVLIQLTVCL